MISTFLFNERKITHCLDRFIHESSDYIKNWFPEQVDPKTLQTILEKLACWGDKNLSIQSLHWEYFPPGESLMRNKVLQMRNFYINLLPKKEMIINQISNRLFEILDQTFENMHIDKKETATNLLKNDIKKNIENVIAQNFPSLTKGELYAEGFKRSTSFIGANLIRGGILGGCWYFFGTNSLFINTAITAGFIWGWSWMHSQGAYPALQKTEQALENSFSFSEKEQTNLLILVKNAYGLTDYHENVQTFAEKLSKEKFPIKIENPFEKNTQSTGTNQDVISQGASQTNQTSNSCPTASIEDQLQIAINKRNQHTKDSLEWYKTDIQVRELSIKYHSEALQDPDLQETEKSEYTTKIELENIKLQSSKILSQALELRQINKVEDAKALLKEEKRKLKMQKEERKEFIPFLSDYNEKIADLLLELAEQVPQPSMTPPASPRKPIVDTDGGTPFFPQRRETEMDKIPPASPSIETKPEPKYEQPVQNKEPKKETTLEDESGKLTKRKSLSRDSFHRD